MYDALPNHAPVKVNLLLLSTVTHNIQEISRSRPSRSAKLDITKDLHRDAQDAIISFNSLDLSNLPAEVNFGIYNSRDIRKGTVNKLAKEFSTSTFTPFLPHCAFPIVMRPYDIDIHCLNPQPAVSNSSPPLLKLVSGTTKLEFCGGQHRKAAVSLAQDILKKNILRYKRQLADSGQQSDNDIPLDPRNIQFDLDFATQRLSVLNLWGCIIYDKSTPLHTHLLY